MNGWAFGEWMMGSIIEKNSSDCYTELFEPVYLLNVMVIVTVVTAGDFEATCQETEQKRLEFIPTDLLVLHN